MFGKQKVLSLVSTLNLNQLSNQGDLWTIRVLGVKVESLANVNQRDVNGDNVALLLSLESSLDGWDTFRDVKVRDSSGQRKIAWAITVAQLVGKWDLIKHTGHYSDIYSKVGNKKNV